MNGLPMKLLKLCWALTFIKFFTVNTDLCTIKKNV